MVAVLGRRPTLAGLITIVGGFFILVGGLFLALFGIVLVDLHVPGGRLFFIGAIDGLVTILVGALIVALPPAKTALGIAAIVLAFVSLPFALGGFLIGFLLTVVGGGLAIAWRPFVLVAGPPPGGPQPPWS